MTPPDPARPAPDFSAHTVQSLARGIRDVLAGFQAEFPWHTPIGTCESAVCAAVALVPYSSVTCPIGATRVHADDINTAWAALLGKALERVTNVKYPGERVPPSCVVATLHALESLQPLWEAGVAAIEKHRR